MVHPKPRALVVDDSPPGRKLLRSVVASAGLAVSAAGDARSALDHHRARPFDLLVTDWIMPGLDGRELVEELRRAGDGTPVLVVTGCRDERVRARCLGLGRVAWLEKPLVLADLRAALEGLLESIGPPPSRTS
jgi:DNA-binding response OmpR family regulator